MATAHEPPWNMLLAMTLAFTWLKLAGIYLPSSGR
jgi:hypothetical protein